MSNCNCNCNSSFENREFDFPFRNDGRCHDGNSRDRQFQRCVNRCVRQNNDRDDDCQCHGRDRQFRRCVERCVNQRICGRDRDCEDTQCRNREFRRCVDRCLREFTHEGNGHCGGCREDHRFRRCVDRCVRERECDNRFFNDECDE